MPMVSIYLLKGKSAEYIKALADGIHSALVAEYDVPPDDRFQRIHQHEPGEMIYDRSYLAGPRTKDFVLVAITAGRPRSTDMRRAFFQRAALELQSAPGIDPANLMIVINTTAPEEWSFGNGLMQMASWPTTGAAQ
ncbi:MULTISPECIES: tautomerase family protein [unclassified Rhizobium]|uniref:tautomerase family protein n=1 Tax=unclassified Rhizobium TaxID=2613769 RepID=UPI0006F27DB7|nr:MULTISPECIES: tautomerase family protein [unclassified Rhizobium]KQV33172.1 decarboxylase [Rhizobium sp. Root1212]KRD21632.1 decarboxylase [Rhizobium sp. Root268]